MLQNCNCRKISGGTGKAQYSMYLYFKMPIKKGKMMNEKSRLLLEEFLDQIPENEKEMFRLLSEQAIALGYFPKKTKSRVFNLDFINSKLKKTILKLGAPDPKDKESKSGIRLKFYANETYSKVFSDAIQNVIEEYDGRYTGCYGCGRCQNKPNGYTFIYPDGRKVFRCGSELIFINGFSSCHLDEARHLMIRQNDFWTGSHSEHRTSVD